MHRLQIVTKHFYLSVVSHIVPDHIFCLKNCDARILRDVRFFLRKQLIQKIQNTQVENLKETKDLNRTKINTMVKIDDAKADEVQTQDDSTHDPYFAPIVNLPEVQVPR